MKKLMIWMMILILLLPALALAEPAAPPAVQPAFYIDLTQIVTALLGLLASLVTYRLIPWIKANTSESQQELMEGAVRIAVYAAEQLYGALHGDAKLAYVQAYLKKKGYDINTDEVSNMIEAYVQELSINQGKEAAMKPPDAVTE